MPNLIKIGYTDRTPQERALELSGTTGVPGKWEVRHSWILADAHEWEQRIFAHLANHRETGEFFKLDPDEAIRHIHLMLASRGVIDGNGLSESDKREAKKQQAAREWNEAEQASGMRELQNAADMRNKGEQSLKFLEDFSQQISESEKQASNAVFKHRAGWMQRNQIKNSAIWGGGACSS